ncbi:MAG TPA: hypothetical protein VKZ53_18495 [Candidatus Angelobacter sp.]|nr:hypothetical protein [Candidatus Angelobacter sp.]
MKLSEEIMLGSTLITAKPEIWLDRQGGSGCSIGGALLATGVNPLEFWDEQQAVWTALASGEEKVEIVTLYDGSLWTIGPFHKMKSIQDRWPWLMAEHLANISKMYFEVVEGSRTLEQLAEYVRSVEPKDGTEQPQEQPIEYLELSIQ